MKFLKDNRILDISEADPLEAQEILDYIKQVGSESNNLIIDENGVPLTLEQEKKYLERNQKSLTSKTFVGKVGNKIVSIGGVNGSPRTRVEHNVDLGISVLKEYWNLGVGQHMMEHIVNYCRMTPMIKNIVLEVRSDNLGAIHIYKKIGFKEVGTLHRKMKIKDQYYDNIVMELLI
jgi:RimJ/RimL family protein N-acetyltransferase